DGHTFPDGLGEHDPTFVRARFVVLHDVPAVDRVPDDYGVGGEVVFPSGGDVHVGVATMEHDALNEDPGGRSRLLVDHDPGATVGQVGVLIRWPVQGCPVRHGAVAVQHATPHDQAVPTLVLDAVPVRDRVGLGRGLHPPQHVVDVGILDQDVTRGVRGLGPGTDPVPDVESMETTGRV